MRARDIPPFALDNYQRAARVVLANHLITSTYPDRVALPLLRRWATELREDLAALFGYRLEVTETTARLFPVHDRLDPTQPARTATERVFDRKRYAYLALTLAVLGRAGDQITLSELADHVAAEAGQVDGVELATDRAADRDAFADAVGWLAVRGAITLADGDASGWASDPGSGEALYDIDRAVVLALFRPPRALQHMHSVRGLLAAGDDDDPARRARRALVERPVVYFAELSDDEARILSETNPPSRPDKSAVGQVELCTGLRAERRAEGIALVDTSGRLSDTRFPSTGTVAQVALLLAGAIADRVLDDAAPIDTVLGHTGDDDTMVAGLDAAIPDSGVFETLADDIAAPESTAAVPYPFLADTWLADTVQALADTYGKTFAAQWQADTDGLRSAVVELLVRMRLVARVAGGVLALPALARYRGVVVSVKTRDPELFTSGEGDAP